MATKTFNFSSFLVRLLVALVLVFVTYNPLEPWSYFHWAVQPLLENIGDFSILKAVAGVLLVIGWGVLLSATFGSLGMIGTILVALLLGLLIWWLIDIGWVSLDNPGVLNWLILIALGIVLAVGVSWSHIRRRLTGQYDMDEVDS